MAYDEDLAERVREALAPVRDVDERRMFGGLAFMVGGHMACGIVGGDLMLRLGADGTRAALAKPHVRPMDFTGTASSTMVFVAPAGLRGAALDARVQQGVAFARSLPPRRAR